MIKSKHYHNLVYHYIREMNDNKFENDCYFDYNFNYIYIKN